MHTPRSFFRVLCKGAPEFDRDLRRIPTRSMHFFDPSNPRMVQRLGDVARLADVLVANLEDAIPADRKEDARAGVLELAGSSVLGGTPLWVRINALDTRWAFADITEIMAHAGSSVDVLMVPKVERADDIHYLDRLLAQLESRHGVKRPVLLHAILESPLGMTNVERIATSSPRIQGMSLGPADLAASRGMRVDSVGGPTADYHVLFQGGVGAEPVRVPQDLWHYSMARMVDACAAAGVRPYYGPFGDVTDDVGCEAQFRAAYAMGCVGAWSLHPRQLATANRVFSPRPEDVSAARRVLAAIPDGAGVAVIDGVMHDDATWKSARDLVDLATSLARIDPDLARAYAASKPS